MSTGSWIRLLVEHHGYKQVILKNTFWLSLSIGGSSLLSFVLAVYVIRTFGPTEYGKFTFALAFASLFSALLDFGLTTAMTREVARDVSRVRHFSDIATLKLILGLCVLIPLVAAGVLVSKDRVVQWLVAILGVYLFLLETTNLFYGLFRAMQRMELEAASRLSQAVLLIFMVVIVLQVRPSVLALGVGYLAAAAVNLVLLVWISAARRIVGALRLSWDRSVWREFATIGAYLAMVKLVGDITTNADSVMLGAWGYIRETGWYNAAAQINGLALFPMSMVSSAIFPALVHLHRESPETFQKYWEAWARGTVVLAVLVCAVVLAKANGIITALYSTNFSPAGFALRILILKAGILYFYSLYYHALLIFDQQRRVFFAVLSGTIVNVVLNILLIPRFSLYGAAVAAVAAHAAILMQYLFLTTRYTTVRLFDKGLRSTLAISLMAGALTYVSIVGMDASGANLFLSLGFGVAIYISFVLMVSNKRKFLPVP